MGSLAQLDADQSIREVILSGGDPLALADDKLATFAEALESRPWIKRLRLHTRVPVVLPSRVDERLLAWLKASRLQKVIVLHANHANEIDADVIAACTALRSTCLNACTPLPFPLLQGLSLIDIRPLLATHDPSPFLGPSPHAD